MPLVVEMLLLALRMGGDIGLAIALQVAKCTQACALCIDIYSCIQTFVILIAFHKITNS